MKTLYHGTSSVNLDCIKKLGLEPGHAKGGDQWAKEHHMAVGYLTKLREPSVFVADDVINAEDFARYSVEEIGGDPVVITLHVPEHVFATFVADELYQRDRGEKPHAWRAHHIDVSCVGEVLPVSPEPPLNELVQALTRLLAMN